MALALNTSHALYPNLVALICVDGGVLKDLKTPSRTFSNVGSGGIFGSGTYGEHFLPQSSGFTTNGASMSPALNWSSLVGTGEDRSFFWAGNSFANGSGGTSPSCLYGHSAAAAYTPELAVSGTGQPGFAIADTQASYGTLGSVVDGAAHTLCLTRPKGDNPTANVYRDGNATSAGFTSTGYGNGSVTLSIIGGFPGQGSANSAMVYFAIFNKILTTTEIANLHSSLTGSNAFALVNVTASVNPTVANVTQSSVSSAVALTREFTLTAATSTESATSSAAAIGFGTPGTITTLPLKNNAGMVLANQSGITVHAYKLTGELAVSKTGLTSSASGVVSFTDSATLAGTQYRIVVIIGTAEGMDKVTAA